MVEFSDEARGHVRTIGIWWQTNRPASPELFRDELVAAVEQLKHHAAAGHVYGVSPEAGTRRILLPRTRYHVYYVVQDARVLIHAVWHANRGQGPGSGA